MCGCWLGAATTLAGCVGNSQVLGEVSATALLDQQKAIAIMRLAPVGPDCLQLKARLARRQGDKLQKDRIVRVILPRSIDHIPVAEVVLDPGEYHIMSYTCSTKKKARNASDADHFGRPRSSLASFRLAAGEIINLGSFSVEVRPSRDRFGGGSIFQVSVTDWPLRDLERYARQRANIYQRMKTRLMTVTRPPSVAPTAEDCAMFRRHHQAGKLAVLPQPCRFASSSQLQFAHHRSARTDAAAVPKRY